jgi:enoyl-CoA hydratase
MSEFEAIHYERGSGTARITLNRPEKLNAISRQMQRELNTAQWEADNDTRVHVAILRGAGRAFSAGYDISSPARRDVSDEAVRGRAHIDDDAWHMENAQRDRMAIFDMYGFTVLLHSSERWPLVLAYQRPKMAVAAAELVT